jgi:phosphofructokinase-like protein
MSPARKDSQVTSDTNRSGNGDPTPAAGVPRRIRRIAVSTSGGDAPGLNAVIRGVTKAAILKHRWEVVGILNGLEGLIDTRKTMTLGMEQVRGIMQKGGTMLGADSSGYPFNRRVIHNGEAVDLDVRNLIKQNFHYLGLDALVCIGGEGTMAIAHELSQLGIPVVGVPKTIDNDLAGTDYTFGFRTAVQNAMEACDRLHDTAASHHRVMILEVMGRYAGWIALNTGISGDADVILIPEIPFDLSEVNDAIIRRQRRGKDFSIIVVAEGAHEAGGSHIVAEKAAERQSDMDRLGGVGGWLARKISEGTGMQCRSTVLGHIQRGGTPTASDRQLATFFGIHAVDLIAAGQFDRITVLDGTRITDVPMESVIRQYKQVDPEGQAVRFAERLGISFGRVNTEVEL